MKANSCINLTYEIMTEYQIRDHIEKRKFQLAELEEFWQDFEDQNGRLSFDTNTFQHVRAKVSSQMAFLQKSINDHEKLLSNGG